jgi:hypothetical protein
MASNIHPSLPVPPKSTYRKVMRLEYCQGGQKALEAVEEKQGSITSYYYQVVHLGREVLQTPDIEKAEEKYTSII